MDETENKNEVTEANGQMTDTEVIAETTETADVPASEPSPEPAPGGKNFFLRVWDRIKKNWSGIVLCLAIAVPAWFLGQLVPIIGSAVFAILIGLVLALFRRPSFFDAGIKTVSKKILQLSIVFLGFGMNFINVLEVGKDSLLIILATITTSLVVSFLLTKLLKIPSKTGILIGVGSSICGGSAIAATAPVIQAEDDDVARSISVIFLFNVIAAFVFPFLGQALEMTDVGFGMWAGTAINDTSSVVAAGQSWASSHDSDVALNYATIVKLTRTLAIIPITLTLAIVQLVRAKRAAKAAGGDGSVKLTFRFSKVFPWFVVFFLIAAVVNTWLFPVFNWDFDVSSWLTTAGKFLITLAMAAIGLNTNVVGLVKKGGKPILLGFNCWVAIAGVSLGMQKILEIW